jgi:hypothetical protein
MAVRRKTRSPFTPDPIPRDIRRAAALGPPDERRDARREEGIRVAPLAQALLKSGYLQEFESRANQNGLMAKSMPTRGVAMARLDTGDLGASPLTLNRPIGLTFEQLREVVDRDVTLGLIIGRRVRQVQRFMKPSVREWQPGFRLKFEDPAREKHDADNERFRLLTKVLLNCGLEFRPSARRALKRDKLKDYTGKVIRDSLTMDAAPSELIPSPDGRLHGWSAVDGGLIYLTDPDMGLDESYEGWTPDLNAQAQVDWGDPSDVFAVYSKQGVPNAFYTHEKLLYPIRNYTTDERQMGYGLPEPEALLGTVTAFLNAMTMNARSISDNSIPPGLLMMFGDFEEEDVEALKQDWKRDVSGPNNRFRLPLMVGRGGEAGAEFVATGTQVNELMYARWITLLQALKCGKYGMDPVEIGFESFSAGGKSSMSGDDTEERLASGNDSGLHPLVEWHFDNLNELLQEIDPEVVIEPTGLDVSKEESQQREKDILTFGELRKRYGEPTDDIPDEVLNAPYCDMSGIYAQTLQRQQQAEAPPAGEPTGDQQDVDGDGVSERGMDTNGDGQPDQWQDVGPDGQQRMLDHEGNVQQVEHPAAPPAGGAPAPAAGGPPQPPSAPDLKAPGDEGGSGQGAGSGQDAPPDDDQEDDAPPRMAKAQTTQTRLFALWPLDETE